MIPNSMEAMQKLQFERNFNITQMSSRQRQSKKGNDQVPSKRKSGKKTAQSSESTKQINEPKPVSKRRNLKKNIETDSQDTDKQSASTSLKRQELDYPAGSGRGKQAQPKSELKLKRINIPKGLEQINQRMQSDRNVRELINQMQQHYQLMVRRQMDTNVLFSQYLPKLRAAKLDGFEGAKKLNLKFNEKRQEHGLPTVDLEEQCKGDLELRHLDQQELFTQLLQMPIDTPLLLQRNPFEIKQIRVKNIQSVQFIVPSKEVTREKVSLADSIPILGQQQRKEHFLQQTREQVKNNLKKYFNEVKQLEQKAQPLAHLTDTSQSVSTNQESNQEEKQQRLYTQTLSELAEFNADTIDYENLSILLYLTQSAISELKNQKSMRTNSFANMKINPYELGNLLNNMNNPQQLRSLQNHQQQHLSVQSGTHRY